MDKETKEEPKVEKKDTDTIEVSKSQLDAILERQTALEKDNEILKGAVSKQKQEAAKDKIDGKDAKYSATLKVWKGIPVIGWRITDNDIDTNVMGQKVTDKVRSEYFLADGTKVGPFELYGGAMSMTNEFTKVLKGNKYPLVKEFTDYNGKDYQEEEFWQIEWENPVFADKYPEIKEIPVRFLNDK